MKPKIVRNYYTVDVPQDCEEDPERRFDLAILEARDRARLCKLPCNWRLVWDSGDSIRICREARV